MRRLAFTFAVCAQLMAPAEGASQNSSRFEGRIVHQGSDAPVEGAVISIAGLTGSARTDGDGRFTWEPVPPVPFQVIVVLPGGQVARPVLVERLDRGRATIHVNPLADESVTVLGAAPSIETTPASGTTLLPGLQIARRSPEHLTQALETVPGVSQVSEGHAAVPAVRGLARGRTLLLMDGARVTAERRVGPSGTFLDPSVIERIDVARGPGSVAYGSDALGGVISVRTRRAEPGSPLRARVTGTAGAGVPDRRGSFEVSKGLTGGGVLVQAHVRNAEDYDSPQGEVLNSGWEDRGFLVHFNHRVADGGLSIGWQSDFVRDVERPRNNSQSVRFFHPFENSHRVTATYEMREVAGFRHIAFTGFLGSSELRTDQDRLATPAQERSIDRADVSANDFHVKGSLERLFGNVRTEFGVDVNGRYDLEALDIRMDYDASGAITRDITTVSVEDAHRTDAGVYFQAETAIGRLARVSGGIRADRVTSRNVGGFFGDRSSVNSAAAGFGALTVGPFDGLSVTAQVSRGFRDPVLSDRYFRGPSGRGFITGNPDLRPETSLQVDLAARYTFPRAQLAAYVYQYRITDLIERYQTQTDFFFFRNRGSARLRGIEVETRSEFGAGYSIEVSAHLARGIALDDGANLDDISPAGLSVLARKNMGERAYGQVRLAFLAEADRPGPGEVEAPGATLLDLGGGWRISPNLELRGTVRNLLDDTYFASPDPRWVYAPGRSASLTAVVEF
jgi:outer membrane receptor protein involved in Fe transport